MLVKAAKTVGAAAGKIASLIGVDAGEESTGAEGVETEEVHQDLVTSTGKESR
jgi:hypothetical protein